MRLNAKALAKHDYLVAALSGFKIALDDAEEGRILLRILR